MAPFEARVTHAKEFTAKEPCILVSDLEMRLRSRFTADTLPKLKARFGSTRFVWLMGADNLFQIYRWHEWTRIFRSMPVAVFNRPTYSFRAKSGVAARHFAANFLPQTRAASLANQPPPTWVFLSAAMDTSSATAIRKREKILRSGEKNGCR